MEETRKIALIPAYEPDEKLLDISRSLVDSGFELIVVNDGSKEECNEIFNKVKEYAKLIEHEKNRGKGAAIKTGLKFVKENYEPPYVVVTVDADGQHKIEDAMRVTEEAIAHPDGLTLGSRKFTGKVPFRSRFGNTITRFIYRSASGTRVRDTQTGLRAVTNEYIDKLLEIKGDRYEYEMNVLMIFAKENIPIREVDIETIYLSENESSHFHPVKDSWRIYKEILKFSVSSFLAFLIDFGLFSLLIWLTGGMEILSNVVARVVSASINFTLNRIIVFHSKKPLLPSLLEYALLAVFILVCNTLILEGFTYLGVNTILAKVITEAVMFTFSWLVQRLFVFRKKKEKTNEEKA